ncbi:MAG: ribonuclease Y [Deltaproteobacteria bacterium]|nr:ribonuclease Y [Deltaproteobacteria bacterium]
MNADYSLVTTAVLLAVGITFGYVVAILVQVLTGRGKKNRAAAIIEDAKRQADSLRKEAEIEAKEFLFQSKARFEEETKEEKIELQRIEKRLMQREENLDRKFESLDKKEQDIGNKEKSVAGQQRALSEKEKEYTRLLEEQCSRLEAISGMTAEKAKEELKSMMIEEARFESAKGIKLIEAEAKETADKKAREIISLAVQRYAGDYIAERAVSVVSLPNDDMKGRIIGREGRNIRSFENATGVDLIVDDTPEAVVLSVFDPIRREIARIALERLISDGRIHPARIEEVVKKVSAEIETAIKEEGERAAFDIGVHGINPELIRLVGKLKYRTSYAQNVLNHSLEVAFLCGIMASELGLNEKDAKRVGFLHDVGKAVDHEVEGSHALIGAELCKKYGESRKVINAIAAHHDEVKAGSIEAILVQAADALSAARPGARREMLETYIKRLEDLENIAGSFKGVEKSYAIQAGREVRILVESSQIDDDQSSILARDVADRIEEELAYPGQIKVTVIRETRAVDYAK